ncbi:hypothetical protein JYK00_02965 [Thermosipho ferrireducens]|uniref:Uncharacterized protein n=1 Tax=Thermosipho ferrireducens TaxID=2571116 RepID=A0ABX7S9C6_9BACT|nr:hypothetical protein [Thermosipho ferrireducens]QTA38496.1 hypothetical protein JYK00_02965 [Thermosipho ferrireducens]
MSNIKIFLCTTFRDFNGTENDEIQRQFLRSIENQNYKNFELVVTLFGEKKVQQEVEKYMFKSAFFHDKAGHYKYSLSQVLMNGIKYALANEENFIILWSTADIIFTNNFFETIIKNYKKNLLGTSHPHVIFPSIEDFHKKTNKKVKLSKGFDLIYFDNVFLTNELVVESISNYKFYDYGIFEHFLISLNELNHKCNMINIFEEARVYKIENDRKLTQESQQFLSNSHKRNSAIFNRFLNEHKISRKYFNLTYCHLKFKITRNKFSHYLKFCCDILLYEIWSALSAIIPKKFKSYLKRILRGE